MMTTRTKRSVRCSNSKGCKSEVMTLRKKRFRNPQLRKAKSKTESERARWKRTARKALANDDRKVKAKGKEPGR